MCTRWLLLTVTLFVLSHLAGCGPAGVDAAARVQIPTNHLAAQTGHERSDVTESPQIVLPRDDGRPDVTTGPALLTLEVRVIDERGLGVPGADVSHARGSGITNGEGIVRLPARGYEFGMPRHEAYWKEISVRAPGNAPVVHHGGWSPYPYQLVRIGEAALRVAGRCVDERGVPVAGVTLLLGDITLVSGEDGAFATSLAPPRALHLRTAPTGCGWGRPGASKHPTWDCGDQVVVPPDESVVVVCRSWRPPGLREPTDPTPPPPPPPSPLRSQESESVVDASATVYVQLESDDGNLVRDGFVLLRSDGTSAVRGTPLGEWHPPPDDGTAFGFRLGPVPPGRYDLLWRARGGDPGVLIQSGMWISGGAISDLGILRIPRPRTLSVRASDVWGRPMRGATVITNLGSPPLAVRCDDDGLVMLSITDPVGLELEVAADGCVTQRVSMREGWVDRVDVCLSPQIPVNPR